MVNRLLPDRRAPSRQGRTRGFTVLELMLVIAVVVLLATLLAPAFLGARAEARALCCGHNLKQIGAGFAEYQARYARSYLGRSGLYPIDTAWPGIPGKLLNSWETFICPAESMVASASGGLEFHSQEGWSAPVGPSSVCQIRRGPMPVWGGDIPATPEGVTDYGYEDIGGPNSGYLGGDYNDCVVRIPDNSEEGSIIYAEAGYSNSIWAYGQKLIQIPSNTGRFNPPLVFPIPAGRTNYGYNQKVCDLGSVTSIVAVDYPQIIANRPGEDIGAMLTKVLPRHSDRVNVLRPDGSVWRAPFSRLDPILSANRPLWGN